MVRHAWKYINGEITLEEAKEQCFYEDWHLAKRQMTWFKRNKEIIWLELPKVHSPDIHALPSGENH